MIEYSLLISILLTKFNCISFSQKTSDNESKKEKKRLDIEWINVLPIKKFFNYLKKFWNKKKECKKIFFEKKIKKKKMGNWK